MDKYTHTHAKNTHTYTHTYTHTHTHARTHAHTHTHTQTDEDDVSAIIQELSSLKSNYYLLGLSLHLPTGKGDQIQVDNPHKSETAFGQVIVQWLLMNYYHQKFGRPSWRLLVQAVDMIDHQLAKDIAKKHQRYVHM